MQRVNWTCPGCRSVYSVPVTSNFSLCPKCTRLEIPEPKAKRFAYWLYGGVPLMAIISIGFLYWLNVPRTQPKIAAEIPRARQFPVGPAKVQQPIEVVQDARREIVSERNQVPFQIPRERIEQPEEIVEFKPIPQAKGSEVNNDLFTANQRNVPKARQNKPHRIQENEDPADEPGAIPIRVRDYFVRADTTRFQTQDGYAKQIKNIKISMNGATTREKSVLKQELDQIEKALSLLKKSKVTAFMPDNPRKGDVGAFRRLQVDRIIDDKTVIVKRSSADPYGSGADIAIVNIETKKMKIGQTAFQTDLFRVSKSSQSNSELMTEWKLLFVAEPVNKSEMEKYRELYEKEPR